MEQNTKLEFKVSGAIDYTDKIDIIFESSQHINSDYYIDGGYTEIEDSELYRIINSNIPHIRCKVSSIFLNQLGYIPQYNSIKEKTYIYYKCERVFKHYHTPYNESPNITPLTIEQALLAIIKERLDII